jgi:hypothetical protein
LAIMARRASSPAALATNRGDEARESRNTWCTGAMSLVSAGGIESMVIEPPDRADE